MAHYSVLHLSPDQYKTTRWSGGTTTQILIFPPEAGYADRSFLWRVSSALVEDEISSFTPLPDYIRHIAVLEGSITLRHGGGPIKLLPYQIHRFDGASTTVSEGRCRDFNLMLRKGMADGFLQSLLLDSNEKTAFSLNEDAEEILILCAEGECTLAPENRLHGAGIRPFVMKAGESALFRRLPDLSSNDTARSEGAAHVAAAAGADGAKLMLAQMRRLSAD